MRAAEPITLHIPHIPGIGIPTGGADDDTAWLRFVWPPPGAQVVTSSLDEVIYCVACALSKERLEEVLNDHP